VLASKDEQTAVQQSIWAGLLCGLMAVPAMIIGVCARGIDWSAYSLAADANAADLLAETPAMVLPLVLRFAVPTWVAVCGLSAITAAVMSSVDSSILSASSMVTWNGYRGILRPDAKDREISVLMRVFIVLLGVFAIMIALSAASVAELWYLCGDIVFCLLFPQLALALFDPRANRSGALSGLAVSLILRAGGGVPALLIPAFIPYPDWSASGVEFPFRTLAMIAGLFISIIVSRVTQTIDPPRPLKPCFD
jgi:high affinity choline transporter 7